VQNDRSEWCVIFAGTVFSTLSDIYLTPTQAIELFYELQHSSVLETLECVCTNILRQRFSLFRAVVGLDSTCCRELRCLLSSTRTLTCLNLSRNILRSLLGCSFVSVRERAHWQRRRINPVRSFQQNATQER